MSQSTDTIENGQGKLYYLVPRRTVVRTTNQGSELAPVKTLEMVRYQQLCLATIASSGRYAWIMAADIRVNLYSRHPELRADKPRRLGLALSELTKKGLLESRGRGRGRFYSLSKKALREAGKWRLFANQFTRDLWQRQKNIETSRAAVWRMCAEIRRLSANQEEFEATLAQCVPHLRTAIDLAKYLSFVKPT